MPSAGSTSETITFPWPEIPKWKGLVQPKIVIQSGGGWSGSAQSLKTADVGAVCFPFHMKVWAIICSVRAVLLLLQTWWVSWWLYAFISGKDSHALRGGGDKSTGLLPVRLAYSCSSCPIGPSTIVLTTMELGRCN